jgi:hypothetical protein
MLRSGEREVSGKTQTIRRHVGAARRQRWGFRPRIELLEDRRLPSFITATNLRVVPGTSPQGVAVADFNGDGNLDLATAISGFGNNGVAVQLGNGDGTFQSAVSYATGNNPVAVAVGQFRGPAKPEDLAVVNKASNSVSILLGNGNGTFANAVSYKVGTEPIGLAVGNFTGGKMEDLAVADSGSKTVNILLNNGNGTFKAGTNVNLLAAATALAAGDLNADGIGDLAVAVASNINDVDVFLGNGDGTFAGAIPNPTVLNPSGVAIADFNHDNTPDLAVAGTLDANGTQGAVSVLTNKGSLGQFNPAMNYAVGGVPHGSGPTDVPLANNLLAIDVNGDASPDLVVANGRTGGNSVSVLLNNTDGTFGSPRVYIADLSPIAVAGGDFNGDKKADVVAANDQSDDLSLLFGNGDGSFVAAPAYIIGPSPSSVVEGQFQGTSQLPDLAVADATNNVVNVLLNNGDGSFAAPVPYSDGSVPGGNLLAVGDFNNDGIPDLLMANPGGLLGLFLGNGSLGNGNGTFQAAINVTPGNMPSTATAIAVGKLHVSKNLDVVVAGSAGSSQGMWVLLGNGNGTFQTATFNPTAPNPSAVAVAPLTAATKRNDVVVTSITTNSVSVLLNNGDGTFRSAVNYFTGIGPTGVAIGALTTGSRGDLAVSTTADGISVLLNNGDGTFQNAVNYTAGVGQNPVAVALAPITGSGNLDVISVNSLSDSVSILAGSGTGTFTAGVTYAVGDGPNSVAVSASLAVGDFNGDKQLDLAVADSAAATSTGTVTVLLSQPPLATQLVINAPSNPVTAGNPFTITVTAEDNKGHIAITYTGTVHFSSSDPQVPQPLADFTFASSDRGVHTFVNMTTLKTAGSQTLTATDTVNASIAGTTTITVIAASAASLLVQAPGATPVGAPFSFTVTAKDPYGNVATSYTGTVHFDSTDGSATLPADFTFTSSDNGVQTFNATFQTVGTQTLTASDTVQGSLTNTATISVFLPATHLLFTAPATATAGVSFNVTVTALDQNNNVVQFYTGTVHFTSTDPGALLPSDYQFQASDNGIHTFTLGVTFFVAGSQQLTVTDTVNASLTQTATVTVVAAGLDHFQLGVQSNATAGVGFPLTVTALDVYGNVATGYSGTVRFSSPDLQRVLPGDYTFTSADQGVHVFTVTLDTAGIQSVAVTDAATGINRSAIIRINPGAAVQFTVVPGPNATAGTPLTLTVSVLDAFGNLVTGYTGTVHFSSSDAQASLPADTAFAASDGGVQTFTVIFRTSGAQSITATDTANSGVFGTAAVSVTSAGLAGFRITVAPFVLVNSGFSLTVTAVDAFNNPVADYEGTIHFLSSDDAAQLPPDYTFSLSDQGQHTFNGLVLHAQGLQTVTIIDTSDSSKVQSATFTVVPQMFATGAGAGGGPQVNLYNAQTGAVISSFFAYSPNFTGGVRVAVGNVDGDGIPDIVTGPGPGGGPEIRVFDGQTGGVILDFMAFDPKFQGGVWVAVGDVNGDGFGDIIVGADAGGGPEVRVFSGRDGSVLFSFFAYDPNFTGGVRVAAGDLNGDGKADIFTAAGAGGGPQVEVFSGVDLTVLRSFFAYDIGFSGGVYVAAGDINGDGKAEIITGPGSGMPDVRIFDGATGVQTQDIIAYDPAFTGGVRVAAGDVDNDGGADIITAPGAPGGPEVRLFDGTSRSAAGLDAFFAYDPNFLGGVYVGGH